MDAANFDEMRTIINYIETNGGRNIHIYSPSVLIAKIPEGLQGKLQQQPLVRNLETTVVDPSLYSNLGTTTVYALEAWNNNFQGLSKSKGLDEYPSPNAAPLVGDAILEKDEEPPVPIEKKPYGAGFNDTSEFLLGDISVAVIFVESDGSIDPQTENWSVGREALCVSEIINGLNWVANQNLNANLSFTYHFYYGRTNPNAQTGYEPIEREYIDDDLWQNEIMGKLGYTGGNIFRQRAFINDLIENDDTHWGIVVWVVDSDNDLDGYFAPNPLTGEKRFAYAAIGGPYIVMTYDNDDWGISNMDAVLAHEIQHSFYAMDEYYAQQVPCTAHRGYLDVENQNSEYGSCLLNVSCIMRSEYLSGTQICTYSAGQIGWYDDDSDGIPNILDTNPITNLDPVPPGIIYQKLLPGNVNINPLNNLNPVGSHNDITLNTAGVESRFDGLYWFDGIILNGNNDFVVGPFPDGVHTVEVRATNSVGNIDPTPETFSAEFQTHFKSLSTTALTHNGARKVWTTPYWDGETGPGYRVVYEDNGDIYYTEYLEHSVFPGTYYWTDEVLLSDGSGNNKNPAITANPGRHACVVWQQYDPGLNRHHIKYREYNYGWQSPVTLSTTTTASDPQPVVGGTYWTHTYGYYYYWHFVWNNGNGLKYALAQQDNVYYVADILGTYANCRNPSITENQFHTIGIAWDKAGHIYYQEVEYDAPQAPYNPVGSPVNLSCATTGNETPSISQAYYNQNIMMLTWSANYVFGGCNEEKIAVPTEASWNKVVVALRKDSNGRWGIPRYIQYGSNKDNITPAVGNNGSYYHALWEVQDEDKLAKLDYLEGLGWQTNSQAQIFSGTGIKTPSISSIGTGGNLAVWALNSASLFDIVPQNITPTTENLEQTTGNEVYREGIIHLSQIIPGLKGTLIVELKPVEDISQNRRIPFAPASREASIFMGSDYFSPAANAAQYKLKVNLRGIGVEIPALSNRSNWEIFRAVLKAAPANGKSISKNDVQKENPPNILKRFNWEELLRIIKSKDFYIEKEYLIDLSEWVGTSIYVDMELLKNLPVELAFAEEIRLNDLSGNDIENGSLLTKLENGISDNSEVIRDYALYPAYPNPFNPSTTIAFDLPETQHVKLEIFDISGRKVRTLVNKTVNAGRHQVNWDGHNETGMLVASGTYLYHIKAGEFTQVRKMMLLK